MPDLTSQANELKQQPDQALQSELQRPTGAVPPFLVMAEAQRRQLTRQAAQGEQAQGKSGSVYDDIVRSMMAKLPPQNLPAAPAGMAPISNATPGGMPGATPPQNFQAPPARMMAKGGALKFQDGGANDDGSDFFSAADPFLAAGSDPFMQSPDSQAQGLGSPGLGPILGPGGMGPGPDAGSAAAGDLSPEQFQQALAGADSGDEQELSPEEFMQKLQAGSGGGGHGGRKGGHGGRRGGGGRRGRRAGLAGAGAAGATGGGGGGGGKGGGFKISNVLKAIGSIGGKAPHGIAAAHAPHFSFMHPMQQHHVQGFHFARGGRAPSVTYEQDPNRPGYVIAHATINGVPVRSSMTYQQALSNQVGSSRGAGRPRGSTGGGGRAPAPPKPHYVKQKEMGDPAAGQDPEKLYYHSYWENPDGTITGDKWREAPEEQAGRSGQANLDDLNRWMNGGGTVYFNGKSISQEDVNNLGINQFMIRPLKGRHGYEIYPQEFPTTEKWTQGFDPQGNAVPIWGGTNYRYLPQGGMQGQGGYQGMPMQPPYGGMPGGYGGQGGMPGQGMPYGGGMPGGGGMPAQGGQQPYGGMPAQGGMPGQGEAVPHGQYYRPREYDEGSGMPARAMTRDQYKTYLANRKIGEPVRQVFTQMFGDRTIADDKGGYFALAQYMKDPNYVKHVGTALNYILDQTEHATGDASFKAGPVSLGGFGEWVTNVVGLKGDTAAAIFATANQMLGKLTPEEQMGVNYGLQALSIASGLRSLTAGSATDQTMKGLGRDVPLIGRNVMNPGQFLRKFTNLSMEFREAAQYTVNAGVPRPITNDMQDAPERVANTLAGKTVTEGNQNLMAQQWRVAPQDVAKDLNSVGVKVVPGPANEQGLRMPRQTQDQIQAGQLPGRADWVRENLSSEEHPVEEAQQPGSPQLKVPGAEPGAPGAQPKESLWQRLTHPDFAGIDSDFARWVISKLPDAGPPGLGLSGLWGGTEPESPAGAPSDTGKEPGQLLGAEAIKPKLPSQNVPEQRQTEMMPAEAPASESMPAAMPAAAPEGPLTDDEIVRRYQEIQERQRRAAEQEEQRVQPAAPPEQERTQPSPPATFAPQQPSEFTPQQSGGKYAGPWPWELPPWRNPQQPSTEARGGRIFDRAPTRGEALSALTRRG